MKLNTAAQASVYIYLCHRQHQIAEERILYTEKQIVELQKWSLWNRFRLVILNLKEYFVLYKPILSSCSHHVQNTDRHHRCPCKSQGNAHRWSCQLRTSHTTGRWYLNQNWPDSWMGSLVKWDWMLNHHWVNWCQSLCHNL